MVLGIQDNISFLKSTFAIAWQVGIHSWTATISRQVPEIVDQKFCNVNFKGEHLSHQQTVFYQTFVGRSHLEYNQSQMWYILPVYVKTIYEVERQRHNKQINYTQDSSFFPRKNKELPWVGF